MTLPSEVIPPEAVEAAAIAWVGEHVWLDSEASYRADYMRKAFVILEAAAPYIRASAFDEAAKKLRSDMDVPQRIWVANKVFALAMIERGDS